MLYVDTFYTFNCKSARSLENIFRYAYKFLSSTLKCGGKFQISFKMPHVIQARSVWLKGPNVEALMRKYMLYWRKYMALHPISAQHFNSFAILLQPPLSVVNFQIFEQASQLRLCQMLSNHSLFLEKPNCILSSLWLIHPSTGSMHSMHVLDPMSRQVQSSCDFWQTRI